MPQTAKTRPIEALAIGWGGLFASIGLLIAAEWDPIPRAVAVAVTLGVGGFLAAVRAEERRALHSAAAAVAAYGFHAVFVLLGHGVALLGGPDAPHWAPGENRQWGYTALTALVAALVGGFLASTWLRPQTPRRRRPVG